MQGRTSSTKIDARGAMWLAATASLFLACLLAAQGCAPRRPPAPVAVLACPPVPMPPKPVLPHVVLPSPDEAGRYCLSQAQVNDLARGIAELQTYAAKLEAAVSAYNEGLPPRPP